MTGSRKYRAAVIGDTGRGNYGHGLDVVFTGMPEIEVVAIADPDEAGRLAAQQRSEASAAYADYRDMLDKEQVDIVAVAPRWVHQRVAMVEAAVAAGAHVFVEKPFAGSLAEADAMIAACQAANRKIAVAHQGRLHPALLHARRLVLNGEIGRVRAIRGVGKMDHRGGMQDLAVLGTHVLTAMQFLAGQPAWVSAELLDGARLAGTEDIREGAEGIGPIAGDGLRATFGYPSDVVGTFESFAGLGHGEDLFGLEIVGETGQLSLRGGITKRLLKYPHPYIVPGAPDDRWEWVTVPDAAAGEVPGGVSPSEDELFRCGNQRLIRDLLAAIAEGREPAASGFEARDTLEVIQAIPAAHVAGGRVDLPLQDRERPLRDAK